MISRRIVAVVFIVLGVGLIVWAVLLFLGAAGGTSPIGFIFPGLIDGPPTMFLILGAVTSAFGFAVLVATFKRNE